MTREIIAKELRVGDVILTKKPGSEETFTIARIDMGCDGVSPYLYLRSSAGHEVQSDASFDNRSATYTVIERGPVPKKTRSKKK